MLWMRAFTWPWSQPLMLLSVDRELIIALEGAELIWPTVRPTHWLPKDWMVDADMLGTFATSTAVTWREKRIIGQSRYYGIIDWWTDRVLLIHHLWSNCCAVVVDAPQDGLDIWISKIIKHGRWRMTQQSSWQSMRTQTNFHKCQHRGTNQISSLVCSVECSVLPEWAEVRILGV